VAIDRRLRRAAVNRPSVPGPFSTVRCLWNDTAPVRPGKIVRGYNPDSFENGARSLRAMNSARAAWIAVTMNLRPTARVVSSRHWNRIESSFGSDPYSRHGGRFPISQAQEAAATRFHARRVDPASAGSPSPTAGALQC
jgi:hypothetical protein